VAAANRSRPHAEALVSAWGGPVYSLDELPQALADADVVISATDAPGSVITAAAVSAAMAGRAEQPLLFVDMAVPRDVEPAVGDLPGVRLFDVDDLQDGLDDALAARQAAIPQVEAIIAQEVAVFETRLSQLAVEPLIADLRQKAEAIRQRELERTLRHLGDADPQTIEHIRRLSRALVNKLLHEPTTRLKEEAGGRGSAEYVTTVRHLFGLEPGENA
jgi:glutamyl-tRNA reductase